MPWRRLSTSLWRDPCFTSVESPESSEMAEVFVKTFQRDYVRVNPIPNAASARATIEEWVVDYNEVHPHSRLGCRSPREYLSANVQPATCPVLRGVLHDEIST
jgi:putative transposase